MEGDLQCQHCEGGLAAMLNIIPELGNLVDICPYEAYALNLKEPRTLATGIYNSLVQSFKTFLQHLDPGADYVK